jgi:radical SAM superfamily enzyme YgiQ (UPF0313 family)
MKVLLVSANTELINMPTVPLGLAFVAAATRGAGHDVELVDLMAETDTRRIINEAIRGFRPDIVGVSVRNIDDQDMESPQFLLRQAREAVSSCKAFSEAPVVVGGAGYSIFPESALEYLGADMGIQGEGEDAFPVLIEKIQRGGPLSSVPGLFLPGRGLQGKRRFPRDLDKLPLPDTRLLSTSVYEGEDFWFPVQTRRGCPMKCSYCSTEAVEGARIRRRSPEVIVRWLAQWVAAGFHRFHFVDNTFNLPPSYAKALCSRIVEAGLDIRWRCIIYPGAIDEDLVNKMARAGCAEVSLGFESGSPEILRAFNKKFLPHDVRRASSLFKEYGIRRMGFLLLGGPGEHRGTVEESLAFIDSLDLEAVKITTGIRIYPHTFLARTAMAEGVIGPDEDLLLPRFYMAAGLEGWVRHSVRERADERPHWLL